MATVGCVVRSAMSGEVMIVVTRSVNIVKCRLCTLDGEIIPSRPQVPNLRVINTKRFDSIGRYPEVTPQLNLFL